jgi:hypothetical protein
MLNMKNRNLSLGLGLGAAALLTGCPNDATIDPGLSGGTGGTESASDTTGGGSAPTTAPGTSVGEATSDSAGTTTGGGETIDPSAGESTQGGASTGVAEESGGSTGAPPECTIHTDCAPGNMCENEVCVPGCTAGAPCPGGEDCCGGTCVDLTTDIDHCMACDNACQTPANIEAFCEGGVCQLGDCDMGWSDCDGQGSTGCESDEACLCDPGQPDPIPCYPGPAGTEGVGICAAGSRTCNDDGTSWGACGGFTLPIAEVCGNALDDDCNGMVDDIDDIDGDGWTVCDGDCCETMFECSDPPLVNPGAFEYVGNMVDDDCSDSLPANPATSDAVAPPDCSTLEDFSMLTGNQLAEAMDLCQFTIANPALPNRIWGVISAELVTPAGAVPAAGQLGNMRNWQSAVLEDYGTVITPVLGPTMAGLSSGRMRDENDPNYVAPNDGTAFGHNQQPPAGYLMANGGSLPASAGCAGNCPAGTGANDGINLRLTIRVPTNALSFRFRFRYFTSEYWTWQCTIYNDFFLALLNTGAAGIPADGNISFDSNGNAISVNNGFFDICDPDGGVGCNTCPDGVADLAGTGMDDPDCVWQFPCGDVTGGGTVWLETTAPVVPGENMILELMVFDVSDGILDSLAVLDGFEWDINPSDVGTEPQ